LGHELGAVGRVGRILVLQLGNQQLQKHVFGNRRSRGGGAARSAGCGGGRIRYDLGYSRNHTLFPPHAGTAARPIGSMIEAMRSPFLVPAVARGCPDSPGPSAFVPEGPVVVRARSADPALGYPVAAPRAAGPP